VGPTPTKPGHVIGSSGPTSAYRMDHLSLPLMARGVKGMIGKGNRSVAFQKAMREHKAIYFMSIGGTGALLASKIKSQKTLLYEDLGTEAVFAFKMEDFPCYVAYDLHGGSIFSEDQ
jgi:fumarate hydratase subunit beta